MTKPSIRRWNPCRDDTLFWRRNEWMVRRSDVIVAYVLHSWGGAAKTLDYARKKKKIILQYEE